MMELIESHFDEELFKEMQELLAEDFGSIVAVFMEENLERVESLKQLIKNKNYNACSVIVHTLKGASSNLGLLQVCQLCTLIEDALSLQNSVILDDLIAQIDAEINMTNLEISKHLKTL